MKPLDKKAQSGSMTMVWSVLFLMLLVAGGIVWGVTSFFGAEYDFRKVDAEILNKKVTDCLKENEFNFSLAPEDFRKQFFQFCSLNEEIIEKKFYILVDVDDTNKMKLGPPDLTQCGLSELNINYPKCEQTTIKIGDLTIFVQTGSNQNAVVKTT